MRAFAALCFALCAGAAVFGVEAPELPTLAGAEPSGRVFLWQNGQKVYVTPEGEQNRLGGGSLADGEEPVWTLWGWTVLGDEVQFWDLTVALAKPEVETKTKSETKADTKTEITPPPSISSLTLNREADTYPVPELVARSGDHLLLVYGARSTQPRWEAWRAGRRTMAKAWDDGRVYYAVAVSPDGQVALVGRSGAGEPLVELAEQTLAAEGLTGRLSAVVWDAVSESPGWRALGLGASTGSRPVFLVWNGREWLSAPEEVLPTVLALSPTGELLAAGTTRKAEGTVLPWVWEPLGPRTLAEPTNPNRVVAFAAAGEAGWRLVLQVSPSGLALVDEAGVQVLEGLADDDQVLLSAPPAVSPADEPAKQ